MRSRVTKSERLLPSLALLLAMILWGSSFVAMKFSFQALHPLIVVLGRLLVASLCFIPFIPSFARLPIKKHHVLPILAMGLCEPCLYFIFEAAALQHTSASQASMITTMLPLMVALTAGILLGERLTTKTLLGFVIAAAGAMWLSFAAEQNELAPNPALGNLLEFLAMVCATGYIILMKFLTRDLPPLFLTAVQAFLGALFFLPVLLLPQVELPASLTYGSIGVVVYLGVFVSVGAYGLYNFGVSRVAASQASAFANLIPVFSIFFGFIILGERLTPWQVVACALVFGGVILSQDRRVQG